MLLPTNARRNINKITNKKIYLYGAPFTGKSTLANSFPDPLFLNTDGNVNSFDAPFIAIKDEVTTNGRITNRTFAWVKFKDVITELEKKENDFKSIVVELVEDLYEHCRLYCYNKLGIEHESDNSFKAWDFVRNEYLNTMKRLLNLEYDNIILESHEDTTKDITRKSGDKITTIKPNINDKIALKLAGMVDVVCRIVVDGDNRKISFKTDEVIFGGGRLNITQTEIPLSYTALMEVYENANKNKKAAPRESIPTPQPEPTPVAAEEPVEEPVEEVATPVAEPQPVQEVPTRSRRIRQ